MATAIVILVAITGIPAISALVIENKVPKVGEGLQRFAIQTRINAQGSGAAPYTGIDNATLVGALRGNAVFDLIGDSGTARVAHGLGRTGVVNVAPAAAGSGAPGSAFSITLTEVNHAACPGIASIMQSVASLIRLKGDKNEVVLKDASAEPPVAYNAVTASAACRSGNVNRFTFIVY